MLSKGKMESKLERIKDLQQKFKEEGAKMEDLIKASKHKKQLGTRMVP